MRAADAVLHRWFTVGTATKEQIQEAMAAARAAKKDFKKIYKRIIHVCCFIYRLKHLHDFKLSVDRNELRRRPFRFPEIRHEAEAAAFAVYGHWVNRGFYYSRDMLFANQPRPKYVVHENTTIQVPS